MFLVISEDCSFILGRLMTPYYNYSYGSGYNCLFSDFSFEKTKTQHPSLSVLNQGAGGVAGASKDQWLWCPGSHPSGQVGHWAVQQQARRPGNSEAHPPGQSLFSSSSPPHESGVSGLEGGRGSLSPRVCGWRGACFFSSVWSDSCALTLSQLHPGPCVLALCSASFPGQAAWRRRWEGTELSAPG